MSELHQSGLGGEENQTVTPAEQPMETDASATPLGADDTTKQNDIAQEIHDDIERSTVFSAPTEHEDKKVGRHVLLKRILSAVLAVAILVGATLAVVRLLPEMAEDEAPSMEPYQIYNCVESSIASITIRYADQTLVLKGQAKGSVSGATYAWTLQGYDPELIDSTAVGNVARAAATMSACGEYEMTDPADFGLDAPFLTVEVKGEADGDFTLTFGNQVNNQTYYYMAATQLPGKVYLIPTATVSGFMVTPYSLAINSAIPAVTKTDANAAYFDEEGKLTAFDSITLAGSHFTEPITIVPNRDKRFSTYANYLTTTPKTRIAASADEVLKIFADGTPSSECVCFDQSAESLKRFGLDDPDWLITLRLGSEVHTYRLKAADKTTYYVAASTDRMIRRVTIGGMELLTKSEKDFYMSFMVLESIADVSNLTLSGAVNASFDISCDEDNVYHVMCGGKEVDAETFKTKYAGLIGTTATDFATVSVDSLPTLTMTLSHHDGSAPTVLSFVKISETRYQYSVGGIDMGQITSSAYNALVRNFGSLVQ